MTGRKPWATATWRKRRADFIKGKSCEWCGSKKILTIHHPQLRNSLTDEEYESFEGTMILCRRCAWAYHKGFVLCQKCKSNYHTKNFEVCSKCAGIEVYKKYIHPWCGKQFLIHKKWWDIEADPPMCCIERCGEPNNCDIALKNWEKIMA